MKRVFFLELCLILVLSFCFMASAFPSEGGYTLAQPDCLACDQGKASDTKEVIGLSTDLLNSFGISGYFNRQNVLNAETEPVTKTVKRCWHGTHLVRATPANAVFKVPWQVYA